MSHLIRTWRHGRQILHEAHGQALVEFALILPVLLLLVFGVIKMGIAATSWSDETHMANEAARFATVNSCPSCTGSQILNDWILTQGDTADLKNPAKTTVTISFDPNVSTKNHCQGESVKVQLKYTYTLLDLPILPKFTLPITATSTQRLESDWGDANGNKAAADKYDATLASPGPC
jgi:hypothetical protein